MIKPPLKIPLLQKGGYRGISTRLWRHAKATPSAGPINKTSGFCRIRLNPAIDSLVIAGFEMICNTIAGY